jgi:hypothetical protein
MRVAGEWRGDTGGNREMGTWINNPKIHFRLGEGPAGASGKYAEVFVGLYINDSRLTKGFDYYLVRGSSCLAQPLC